MSQDYLSDLKLRLGRFRLEFGNRLIASITVEEIDDWLRNLEHEPRCEIQVGSVAVPAVYEPSTDVTADLRRAVELLQAKYGSGWVEDWYVDRGRVPVKLRVE